MKIAKIKTSQLVRDCKGNILLKNARS